MTDKQIELFMLLTIPEWRTDRCKWIDLGVYAPGNIFVQIGKGLQVLRDDNVIWPKIFPPNID